MAAATATVATTVATPLPVTADGHNLSREPSRSCFAATSTPTEQGRAVRDGSRRKRRPPHHLPAPGWKDDVPPGRPIGKKIVFKRFKADGSTAGSSSSTSTGETAPSCRARVDVATPSTRLLARRPIHRLRPHRGPARHPTSTGMDALLGDLHRQCLRGDAGRSAHPRAPPGQPPLRRLDPSSGPTEDPGLLAHPLPAGGEHGCVRPADRLTGRSLTNHSVEDGLPGRPTFSPDGSECSSAACPKARKVPPTSTGFTLMAQACTRSPSRRRQAVPGVQLLSGLPQRKRVDHRGTRPGFGADGNADVSAFCFGMARSRASSTSPRVSSRTVVRMECPPPMTAAGAAFPRRSDGS